MRKICGMVLALVALLVLMVGDAEAGGRCGRHRRGGACCGSGYSSGGILSRVFHRTSESYSSCCQGSCTVSGSGSSSTTAPAPSSAGSAAPKQQKIDSGKTTSSGEKVYLPRATDK